MNFNQELNHTSDRVLSGRPKVGTAERLHKIFQCEVQTGLVLRALKNSAALRRKTGFAHHQQVLLTFEPGLLWLTSYALDKGVSFSACFPVPGCEFSDSVVVDGYCLTAALAKVKAPCFGIGVNQEALEVWVDGERMASLPQFSMVNYPVLSPDPNLRFLATLTSKQIQEIWRKVAFCADDRVHCVFDGRQLEVIAANRFSMVRYSLPCVSQSALEITIPSLCLKTCAELEDAFQVEVARYGLSENGVLAFSSRSHQVMGRTMEDFPNYRAVAVSARKTLDFWIPNLQEGLRHSVAWAKDLENPMTRMDLDLGKRCISLTTGDQTCQIPYACGSQVDEHPESLFINPVLVGQALTGFPHKGKVRLSFEAPEKPIRLEALSQALEVFISPIRPPKSS